MSKYGTLIGRTDGSDLRVSVPANDPGRGDITNALRHLTVLPKNTSDGTGELRLPLSWAVITQVARMAEQHSFTWLPQADLTQWITDEFTRRFADYKPGDLKFDLSSLTREPMPHQVAGAYMAADNQRVFLADAAGTGKTFTALLTLAEMHARGDDPFPAFVVTPASVVDPWLEELQACFPRWTFTAYRGPRRKKLSSRYQVYVMSWDTFRTDMFPPERAKCECGHVILWKKAFQQQLDNYLLDLPSAEPRKHESQDGCGKLYLPIDTESSELPALLELAVPRTIILDEAHALCNVKTRQSQAARKIAKVAEYAVLLSGTPITNNIGGFFSALNVIDTRSFTDQDRYKARYTDRYIQNYREEIEGLTTVNREEFYTLMQGTMRRVSKRDVLKDLPDKTYTTRLVDLPPSYRRAYDEMEADMLAHIPDVDEPLPVMNTLAQLQRLTQLACSSCDVQIDMRLDEDAKSLTFGEEIPHYTVTMQDPSWKVDELMQIMSESSGEPIVTFAPHTQLVNLAGVRADKEGYRVGYIKGGQSSIQRTQVRTAFQNGELDLLAVNTQAGGVGLTLHRSHTAVFLERSFAYWREDQAEDRLHRKGQTEKVTIIDIVARNTIEQRAHQALVDKSHNLAELIQDAHAVRNFLGA